MNRRTLLQRIGLAMGLLSGSAAAQGAPPVPAAPHLDLVEPGLKVPEAGEPHLLEEELQLDISARPNLDVVRETVEPAADMLSGPPTIVTPTTLKSAFSVLDTIGRFFTPSSKGFRVKLELKGDISPPSGQQQEASQQPRQPRRHR